MIMQIYIRMLIPQRLAVNNKREYMLKYRSTPCFASTKVSLDPSFHFHPTHMGEPNYSTAPLLFFFHSGLVFFSRTAST